MKKATGVSGGLWDWWGLDDCDYLAARKACRADHLLGAALSLAIDVHHAGLDLYQLTTATTALQHRCGLGSYYKALPELFMLIRRGLWNDG